METSKSEKLQRVVSPVKNFNETKSHRISLDKINITNLSFMIEEGIKEIIELSPDKQKIITKKLFVWSDESRFNDSKIEIFCNLDLMVV